RREHGGRRSRAPRARGEARRRATHRQRRPRRRSIADPWVRGAIMSGAFVVFEGIDGAGTTTQTERYAAHLRANKRLVHTTREPSGGPIGSLLRLVHTQRIAMPSVNQAK